MALLDQKINTCSNILKKDRQTKQSIFGQSKFQYKRKALHDEFPASNKFNLKNGIDKRYAALTDKEELKEFLID